MSLVSVLEEISAVVGRERLPILIFDLDSTLFDTAGRNMRILQEFAAEYVGVWPQLEEHVGSISHSELGWNVGEPLIRRGCTDPAIHERLLLFWRDRFFTSAYVEHDMPAPGAAEYVAECYRRGALVYYLTGRHVGGMEVGTARSLTRHGFPMWRGRCVLHLKPNFTMPDLEFKQGALDEVRSLRGDVVASFENEPGNANLLQQAFPAARHFLYGHVHSPEPAEPHAALIPIDDFSMA